jgi:hypothetical protein
MGRAGLIVIIVVAILIVVVGAWFGLSYAYTRPTGPVTNEDREVSELSSIEVAGRGTLVVTIGDTPALRVQAKESVLDRLETEVDGDTLRLHERWSWLGIGPLLDDPEIIYYVTTPNLSAVDLSGSVTFRSDGPLETDALRIGSSGSSDTTIDVTTRNLSLDNSGSSDVILTGTADILSIGTSGSSNIDARGLAARIATIDCSGSSNIAVNASEQLTVDASGSSEVTYIGDPQLDTNISGSGEVRPAQ